jgi:hypothetical protein
MNSVLEEKAAVKVSPRAGGMLTLGAAAIVMMVVSPFARLVSHFGFDNDVAQYIIGLIAGGSIWLLGVAFPAVIPYLVTIRGILAAFGTGFAVGW